MTAPTASAATSDPAAPIPRPIPCIVGNEGCERFSFYGMRNILTVFLVSSLLLAVPAADRAGIALRMDFFAALACGLFALRYRVVDHYRKA